MKHTLMNRHIRMIFDDETRTVVSLERRAGSAEYLQQAAPYSLYQLATTKGEAAGTREVWTPGALRSVRVGGPEQAPTMVIELTGCEGGDVPPIDVRITIGLKADCAESTWQLELANRSADHQVVEVLFPYLRGLRIGEEWEDDVLIYPHHAGEKTVNPVEQYASGKYMKFWRAQTIREADCFSREINYCGLASMSWMYLYDADYGFYIGSHDPRFPLNGLRVETGGPDDPWIGFGFRKHTRIRQGEVWDSGSCVIALTDEDWRWGARRYRRYIDEHIDMPEHPGFLLEEAVLNQCYNFKRAYGVITNRFENIPAMYDEGKERMGMKHMFIASWNRSGFDQDYPEYHPDMELGTPMELYNGVRYVKDNGGFVTFYINVRIFDIESDYHEKMGKRWAIKDVNGNMIHEQYGPYRFTVNCPAHIEWQNHIIDYAAWMVQAYGATGIYLDQLGSAEPFPCHDPNHSHGDIGDFNNGYLHIMRELLPKMRRLNPDSFLMIENCGDIYGSRVWGSLTWNGEYYDEFYNLFKYTFPEYVQVNMVNPRRDLNGEVQLAKWHWDMARAMLLGSVFWISMEKFKDEEDASTLFMEKVARFRQELQPLLAKAVYLDQEGVTDLSDGLDVSRWRLDGGGQLFLVSNLGHRTDGRLMIRKKDMPDGGICRIVDLNGGTWEMPLESLGERWVIPIPAAELSRMEVRRVV